MHKPHGENYAVFSQLSFPPQEIPLRKRGPDNDEIAHKAPDVRHLTEQDGTEDSRVDDLRVVKDGDVPRRVLRQKLRR